MPAEEDLIEKDSKDLSEKGLTGLVYSGGQVTEEFLPSLQGKKGLKVYREMRDNDPIIGSIMFAIDMHIRQATWTVNPNPKAGSRSEKDAEFLQSAVDDLSHTWQDFVCEIMTMIPYGFSTFETVYKQRKGDQPESSSTPSSNYNDGKIGWRKFATRSQDTIDEWIIDDSGGIQGFIQKAAPDYKSITIPIQKALLFRTTTIKGNPEGRSALRNAYRPWFFKNKIEETEATGIERDLAGLPVAYVDAAILREDASQDDKAVLAAIRNIVTNIKRDREEGVVWPVVHDANGNLLYDLKLLNSGGSRTFNTSEIIDRYDKRIAMTVLADFIMLGQQAQGSFALASSKTNTFATAIGAWLDVIDGVINTYAVPKLFQINGMDATLLPTIEHGDIESPELAELGAYLSQIAAVGMPLFPNERLEDHLLDAASLPKPTDEERKDQQAGANEAAANGPMDPNQQQDGAGGPLTGDQIIAQLNGG